MQSILLSSSRSGFQISFLNRIISRAFKNTDTQKLSTESNNQRKKSLDRGLEASEKAAYSHPIAHRGWKFKDTDLEINTCEKQFTAHPLERPKPKPLTPPNAGEDDERQELSSTDGGNEEWCSHFGRQLAVSYHTKHALTIPASRCAPHYHFSTRTGDLCSHKNLQWTFITAKMWEWPRYPLVG